MPLLFCKMTKKAQLQLIYKFYNIEISTTIRRIYVKLLNFNCITNTRIWNTCVTWRGTEYELPDGNTIVSKHVGV